MTPKGSLALALAFAACAPVPPSGMIETDVVGSARLSHPLGECLERALDTLDGSRDVGRVTVDSTRNIGRVVLLSRDVVQAQHLRLFQSQYQPGPRFFDALVVERACAAGDRHLEVIVSLFSGPDPAVASKRIDAVVTHVLSTCQVEASELSPARVLIGDRTSCE